MKRIHRIFFIGYCCNSNLMRKKKGRKIIKYNINYVRILFLLLYCTCNETRLSKLWSILHTMSSQFTPHTDKLFHTEIHYYTKLHVWFFYLYKNLTTSIFLAAPLIISRFTVFHSYMTEVYTCLWKSAARLIIQDVHKMFRNYWWAWSFADKSAHIFQSLLVLLFSDVASYR